MKNQIQQQSTLLHDAPSQSTCPKPVVEIQIPTTSVTQTSSVKDFEVYSHVFKFNDYIGHILIFTYIYIHQITIIAILKNLLTNLFIIALSNIIFFILNTNYTCMHLKLKVYKMTPNY